MVSLFTNVPKPIYVIELQINGEIINIESTDDHPFYVSGLGWIKTINLQRGYEIVTKDGIIAEVKDFTLSGQEKVTYNFTVEDFHTYYVTEYGVLVHNCGDEIAIKDLDPLHSKDVVGDRPDLANLSDDQLLDSIKNPLNGDKIKINTESNKLMDGNSRAYELKKRADDPNSNITPGTLVPVERYTPDNSAFPDLGGG